MPAAMGSASVPLFDPRPLPGDFHVTGYHKKPRAQNKISGGISWGIPPKSRWIPRYSYFNASTGFARAAFKAWTPTIIKAKTRATTPARPNVQSGTSTR